MHSRVRRTLTTIVALLLLGSMAVADLPAAVKEALASSKFVYISSTRKDGSLGKSAEIWFLYHKGAVYVGTLPTSWRAKRIKWKRPKVKIAVGKSDGPSFLATGAIVNEPDVQPVMFQEFAKKYPDGWSKFEDKFRTGFKDGSRVMIKYTPEESR